MKYHIFKYAAILALSAVTVSCNDYLDKEPLSKVSPEQYFNDEGALQTYCNNRYSDILPGHAQWSYGLYGEDKNTDMQSSIYPDGKYQDNEWRTDQGNDNYEWKHINTINYFFDQVLPKYEAGAISGNKNNIDHYIGEMYFFRAYEYFKRLKMFGDLPIVTTCLPDELGALTDASRRHPRNEVARFILEDLDKAYELLKQTNMATTRINANTAMLLKSRVALYEGTFEKNFAGTAFVPGTAEWPGKSKSYNADFAFKAGTAEDEVKFFLREAVKASEIVADEAIGSLTINTGAVPQEEGKSLAEYEAENPWLAMFATLDLSKYPEVLLWRQYSDALGVNHNVVVQAQKGNQGLGVTRGCVDGFIMADGLPIYASRDYKGDNTIHNVREGRDPRLVVLLKEPGQKNVLIANTDGTHANPVEGIPAFWEASDEQKYSTGYALRKGNTPDQGECGNGKASTGCPVFRSVEALLNYIEAYYELNGDLGGKCDTYWRAVRGRHHGLESDYMITINATQMSEEAKCNWAAYTAGNVINAVRFNIRRERQCELMAEGFRWDDLVRWRSLDQLCSTPGFHIEGCHIWNADDEMIKYLAQFGSGDDADPAKLKTKLEGILSHAGESEYVRPHRSNNSNKVVNGLTWHMAHYLQPMPIKQMMLTSPDGSTVSDSPLYQNPYWPSEPNQLATK